MMKFDCVINKGNDVNMSALCGCDNCKTLTDCESCPRYYSCDNVAKANALLADWETELMTWDDIYSDCDARDLARHEIRCLVRCLTGDDIEDAENTEEECEHWEDELLIRFDQYGHIQWYDLSKVNDTAEDRARELIARYVEEEFETEKDHDELHSDCISAGFTTITDEELPIQFMVNIPAREIRWYCPELGQSQWDSITDKEGVLLKRETMRDIAQLNGFLKWLSFEVTYDVDARDIQYRMDEVMKAIEDATSESEIAALRTQYDVLEGYFVALEAE